MKHVVAVLLISIILVDAAAAEKVNKCTDATGKVVYQKDPCEASQRGEEKQIDPNRNAVKMELPPDEPKSAPTPTSAPASPQTPTPAPVTNTRPRRSY
jgi:hypothetical protein